MSQFLWTTSSYFTAEGTSNLQNDLLGQNERHNPLTNDSSVVSSCCKFLTNVTALIKAYCNKITNKMLNKVAHYDNSQHSQ